jgi:hypothetical protein
MFAEEELRYFGIVVATPRLADGTFQEDPLGIVLSQDFSDASPDALQFGVPVLCIGTFLHLTSADVHFATQPPVAALLPPTAGICAAVSSTSLVVVPKTIKAMRALPDPPRQSWFAAVFSKYGNLERLETFDPLRHLPDDKKTLRTRHVNRHGKPDKPLSVNASIDYSISFPKRQKLIAQSTAEAEIIALNETVPRVTYVHNNLLEFFEVEMSSEVHTDNEACRLISNTSTCSDGTRHIDMALRG